MATPDVIRLTLFTLVWTAIWVAPRFRAPWLPKKPPEASRA
jgi:hypothetical protein